MDLPASLSAAQRRQTAEMVEALAAVPGIAALVLGGSHARGTARPDSDVDVGLLYRADAPPDVAALRTVAARFAKAGAKPVVTELWEWGPWVNGGAWLDTALGKVDWLYRELEHVERTIAQAERGEREWSYAQTPVYGFHSVTYLAEIDSCLVLHDPGGVLAELKRRVAVYPAALRARIVQDFLWHAEFTLRQTRGPAERGDVYLVAGCLTRILSALTQALFALNACYFPNDKGALELVEGFADAPAGFRSRVHALLAAPGATPAALEAALREAEALHRETVALAGPLYRSRY